jgi:hypothetical protein
MPAPYYFDQINQAESHIVPGVMQTRQNAMAMYYRRFLMQRAFAIFDFEGAPKGWNIEYLKFCLMCWGYAAVFRTDKFGVIPQQCGVSGYDVFYRPTRAIITNPLFDRTYDLKIGEDCELIRLAPDWAGIADLIGHYADQLALVTSSIITNLYNSKLAYVFAGSTKAFAESFKAMYDKISEGNPAVFVDKQLIGDDGNPQWRPFQQSLKETYIVDLLQGAERTIMMQFYTDIGIPNIPYEKNERLNQMESSINDYSTLCLVNLWKTTISNCLDKVNSMFDLNIKIKYNKAMEEVLKNGDGGQADSERTISESE